MNKKCIPALLLLYKEEVAKSIKKEEEDFSEDQLDIMHGERQGYRLAILYLSRYARGSTGYSLRDIRRYMRYPAKQLSESTLHFGGRVQAFRRVLQDIAPVPRQKRCDYCEDVLEPETARKNLCSGMYQPLCICCYEALEEMALRGETV